jgi:LysM repeat protein
MKSYRSLSIFTITLLVLGLVACVRAIPGSTKATTTAEEESSILPTSATDVMNQIYLFATQTAMAKMENTPGAQILTESPESPVATEESVPKSTSGLVTPQPAVSSPTQAPLIAAPPLVVPSSYTLKKGEFPYCIARRFNVNPSELLSINGLSSYSVVHTGMTLIIPQTGRPFPGYRALRAHPTSYTVGSGDTIYTIACYFGDVDPNAIAVVNGLSSPYGLTYGQVLRIP